jgi:hypothetical protein
MPKAWIVAATLTLAICGVASGDDFEVDDIVIDATPDAPVPEVTAPAEAAPLPPHTHYDGRSAIDAWDDTRGYRYGTEMLFPFTRGMEDAGIRGWARWPMGILTIPLDVALLPTGLIAGLWGG